MKFIFFPLFLLFLSPLFAQYTSDRYHPKEAVRLLRIDTCFMYAEGKDKSLVLDQFVVYDTAGFETACVFPGESATHYEYYYNHAGNRLITFFWSDNEGFRSYRIEKDTFIYNKAGQEVKTVNYDNEGNEITRGEYFYENDTLRKATSYFESELINTTKIRFDYKRNRRVETTFNTDGKDEITLFQYDSKGNLLSFTVFQPGGDTSLKHKYVCDEFNRRTDFYVYGITGVLEQYYKTVYDKNGLILYEESYVEIKKGDIKNSKYQKTIYRYSYRKN